MKNYDVIGWLRVQGTNIDYPIIHDNGLNNISEIIEDFVWQREKTDKLQERTVILGHNIKNVSSNPLITNKNHTRFEQLMSFVYYDFAKENQFIQYTKNGKEYVFQIFSVSFIDEKDLIQTGNLTEEEKKAVEEKQALIDNLNEKISELEFIAFDDNSTLKQAREAKSEIEKVADELKKATIELKQLKAKLSKI